MKKLFVVLFALLLTFSAAFAQETVEVVEVNWEDVAEYAAEIDPDGAFYQIADLDLYMWIPSVLQEAELTDEDLEAGYISYLTDADETAGVLISYEDMEGATLDDMFTYFSGEEGFSDVEKALINGLEAVSLVDDENDSMLVCFMTDKGYLIEFFFTPYSDENFQAVAAFMAASIQTAE